MFPVIFCFVENCVSSSVFLFSAFFVVSHSSRKRELLLRIEKEEREKGNQKKRMAAEQSERDKFIPDGIQVISDIHLEFAKAREKLPPIPVRCHVLALVGDIGYYHSDQLKDFLIEQKKRFKHVVFVAGNHEFYEGSLLEGYNYLKKEVCEKIGVVFLEKESVEFEEIPNVRFLGCTLWTNVPQKSRFAIQSMVNDYHLIDHAGSKLTVEKTNQIHEESVEWIEKEIKRGKEEGRRIVILTHHSPTSFRCLNVKRSCTQKEMVSMEFTKLDRLMVNPVVLWGFGHTHISSDAIEGEHIRVVSNQAGYVGTGRDPRYDGGYVFRVLVGEEERKRESDLRFDSWSCFEQVDGGVFAVEEDSEEEKASQWQRGKVGKSKIVFEVKPRDGVADLESLEKKIRKIEMKGLEWKSSEKIPVALGLSKLSITCHVVDDVVSVDDLEEKMDGLEGSGDVESVDVITCSQLN